MKNLLAIAIVASIASSAYADQTLTIGVLTDMSGLYKDNSGPGSVEAAKLAVEDYKSAGGKLNLRVVSADHQNKPDIAVGIARKWFDVDGIDMIVDVPNSSIALAVSEVAKAKNKALFVSSSGSSELTGAACSPNTVHFTYDTFSLAKIAASELVAEGKKKWYFITADYSFGLQLQRDAADIVQQSGGTVLGQARAPINTSDFSSFLLQAQSMKPEVVGFANSGADLVNSMKQAAEFGLGSGSQKLAGLLVFITDIKALGLSATQGLSYADAFYWDYDEKTRSFSKRFAERNNGAMPTMGHAGVYSSVLAYVRAAELGQASDGGAVIRSMKSNSWNDNLFGDTRIRMDGRAMHRMLFVQVKTPGESKGPYDLLKVKKVVSAEGAFRPESEGKCPLSKSN